MSLNILLTSAGRRSYMVQYFKEALAGRGVVHAGNSAYSPALQAADRAVITPLIYDAGYIDFLLDYCKTQDISAIIPLFDIDVPILAKSRELFTKESIRVVVSDYPVTVVCNDKWKTYTYLKKNKIPAPATFSTLDSALAAVNDQTLAFPVIVKPRWGMGSIGVYSAADREEMAVFYNKVKVEIGKTYLNFESRHDLEQSVLVQEQIAGQEYGLDIVNDLQGRYVATFVKRKKAMRSGETDIAVTENNPAIEAWGEEIGRRLGHVGNLDVDCFVREDHVWILEMNCRFGGGYPFSHLAGANIPLAIVHWLDGQKPGATLFKINYGVEGIKDMQPIVLKARNGGAA
ncbi:MAG: ATP-grasp domain-containing protein [Candidatus Omnitrophica bacterium]|nr:ATP-grasp domain-containing protein [Candidatus Omnitrophota bacterium]